MSSLAKALVDSSYGWNNIAFGLVFQWGAGIRHTGLDRCLPVFLVQFAPGLVVISVASQSYAYDYKTYPGSLCQAPTVDEAVDFIRGPGFIYNTNVQQRRLVTCPIIRDRVPHEGQTGERTQLDIGVWFNGTGITEEPVECKFYSMGANGGEVYVSPPQYTDPTKETQALYWAVSPEQTATDGTYSINCELPAYVFLLRYIAGENNETDNGF